MAVDMLFLGRLLPKENEAQIRKKMRIGMVDAANTLQWNIINGLESNQCGVIKILNCLPVNSWPKGYADAFVPEFCFSHTNRHEAKDINVGYNNLSIIKQFRKAAPFKRKLKEWVNEDNGLKKVLFLYSADLLNLNLAKYAKSLNPSIETVCLIADIPEFSTIGNLKGIKRYYKDYCVKKSDSLYKFIDKFILLTAQMADKLKIKVPYMVMEGIAGDAEEIHDTAVADKFTGRKFVLYTGTLNYKFGIKVLLDAFQQIEDGDLELVICGFGEAESLLKQRQKEDKRIVFLGKQDRKYIVHLQKQATVLVNPRQNNEEFTKYSFPSKTMEYLASGTPVVAYKLDGIPDVYDEYINYVNGNSAESLASKLRDLCELDDNSRKVIGKKGQDFVLKNKNAIVQTKRILNFLNNVT